MKSRSEIEHDLVLAVSSELKQSIEIHGHASLLVSGGSTPIHLFQLLSDIDIDWSKVHIIPVDERYLPSNHEDQNGTLIKKHLLQKNASKAIYHPLVLDSTDIDKNLTEVKQSIQLINRPFTVVILGMGTDGHTASLFPCSEELSHGLDLVNEEDLIITNPKNAPYQRVSFTRRAILNTKNLFLHCYGEDKKQILDHIDTSNEQTYPIKAFINQSIVKPEIFWSK